MERIASRRRGRTHPQGRRGPQPQHRGLQILLLGHRPHDAVVQRFGEIRHGIRPQGRGVLPKIPPHSQRGFDLHLSLVRRDRGAGRGRHADEDHERRRGISRGADLSRSEGPRSGDGRGERRRRGGHRPQRGAHAHGRIRRGGQRGGGDPHGDGRRCGAEGDHRVGSAENPRADPQGVAAVDAGRGRFREDLDGQDRRGRNARGRRGDVPGDPGLLRQNGPQGRLQGRRRGPHGPKTPRSTTRSSRRYSAKSGSRRSCSASEPLRPRTTFFRPSKARRSNTSNRHETGWRRSAGPFLSDRPAPTHEKRRPLTGPPLHTYRSRLTEANP